AISLTYYVTIKYSQQICAFGFKYIPHEAMLGLFFGLVLMLAYMGVGWINIGGVLLVVLVAGVLHLCGVRYGVLFMTLYAASWPVTKLICQGLYSFASSYCVWYFYFIFALF